MVQFCRDTRHLQPEEAREVWVEVCLSPAHITHAGRPALGWSVCGRLFGAAQGAAERRLARYRAFGCGGTAGRAVFASQEEVAARDTVQMLRQVAESDQSFVALTGDDARAERRRVWSV